MKKNNRDARNKKEDETYFSFHASRHTFHEELLSWYHKHKRDLPWRKTNDPYKIWLSEIMLQQTQVVTVIDYYHRFLTRFPNITSLSQAREEEVLTLWSGLGYYSRARNLQRAAQQIVRDHDAKFPHDPKEILSLPGIGKYTLGAIASIAFNQPLALVDGNVIRVYSRLFALKGIPNDLQFQKKIWKIAEKILPQKNPGDFNQALMELGATVCTPKNPMCLICPVQKLCKARVLDPHQFPDKKRLQKNIQLYRAAFIIQKEEKILFVLDENSRWHKGLWQLPGFYFEKKEDLKNKCLEFLTECNLSKISYKPLRVHHHAITHHRITIFPFAMSLEKKGVINFKVEKKWLELADIKEIGLPAPDRKILQNLSERD